MDYKKNIRRVFWLFLVLFVILSVQVIKFIFFDARSVIASPYNARLRLMGSRILKGDILDNAGNVLATSNGAQRVYPMGRQFAHIIGFSGYNSQGIEILYAPELLKASGEISQRVDNLKSGAALKGDTLITTLDTPLQQKAYELLNGRSGAIIAIEPSTGKVLACASSPSFDINRVSLEWDALKADTENNPLLNRATQGLYPPGSIFKIVTLAAAIRNLPDFENFTYTCTGSDVFGSKTLRCYNENAHGEITYKDAFAKSCNTYFAALAEAVGAEGLIKTANELLPGVSAQAFLYVNASFAMQVGASPEELAETAIGQGKTLVTPMHMALLTCAIANDGRLMRPYAVDGIVSAQGKTIEKNLPGISETIFSTEECEILKGVMVLVADGGTARQLDKSLKIAGKTGSAENPQGDDHGWFVAFAPADVPQIVVAVMFENCGGSAVVLPAAEEMIRLATK